MKAIHTILHDHLSVRKLCSRWIPHNLTEAHKQARVKGCKKMLKKFNQCRSNLVYNIVTGNETSIHMSPKINNNPLFGYFKMNRNQQKLFVYAVLPSKWLLRLYRTCDNRGFRGSKDCKYWWYTTICLPEVINELRRTNRNRRIILHHDNASCHSTSNR